MSGKRAGFLQTGGLILDVMDIVDGEYLLRSGRTIISGPGGGGAFNIDGGNASSIYDPPPGIDGGGA